MDLREDLLQRDDLEPTPGASRVCLKDLGILSPELVDEVEAELYVKEETRLELLLHFSDNEELVAEVESAPDCLKIYSLRLRKCNASVEVMFELLKWPEVSKVAIEGDCFELIAPGDSAIRLKNFVEKLGLKTLEVLAYRRAP
ncbi:MAG: hypothetical protein QXN05_03860 [Acidilobaceae archaeon]